MCLVTEWVVGERMQIVEAEERVELLSIIKVIGMELEERKTLEE